MARVFLFFYFFMKIKIGNRKEVKINEFSNSENLFRWQKQHDYSEFHAMMIATEQIMKKNCDALISWNCKNKSTQTFSF